MRTTVRANVYSNNPSGPCTRPEPLSFTPPNGTDAIAANANVEFIATIPHVSWLAIRLP